jgi:hypothetical protein
MNQGKSPQEKQQIYDEIDKVRFDVSNEPKIKLRAQENIFEYLDKAVEHLKSDDSKQSLYNAMSQIEMARKRQAQATRQNELLPWLPLGIALYLFCVIGVLAWLMITYKSNIFASNSGWLEILFGAALWGAVGSTADGLRELRTRLARQELDPIRALWYITHPVIGAVAGSILFLIIYAGLLAISDSSTNYSPALLFAVAAVGGFSQRQVIEYFRDTLVKILNIQKEPPEEAG